MVVPYRLGAKAEYQSALNGSLTISRQNDIVCLPNDFATNFMECFNVEKEQF